MALPGPVTKIGWLVELNVNLSDAYHVLPVYGTAHASLPIPGEQAISATTSSQEVLEIVVDFESGRCV
jgi:hypothetical protein